MDGLIVLVIALFLVIKNRGYVNEEDTVMQRETMLNPEFYQDENAFMKVAHELGFH